MDENRNRVKGGAAAEIRRARRVANQSAHIHADGNTVRKRKIVAITDLLSVGDSVAALPSALRHVGPAGGQTSYRSRVVESERLAISLLLGEFAAIAGFVAVDQPITADLGAFRCVVGAHGGARQRARLVVADVEAILDDPASFVCTQIVSVASLAWIDNAVAAPIRDTHAIAAATVRPPESARLLRSEIVASRDLFGQHT